MKVKNSLITNYLTKIKRIIKENSISADVFIFGSVLSKTNYRDVDLVLIYDENTITLDGIVKFRNEMNKELKKEFKKTFNINLLSKKEESKSKFLNKINAHKIAI